MIEAMVAASMLDMELSADGWLEAVTLAEQIHCSDVEDTYRFAQMFTDSLAAERERFNAAMGQHDHAAMDSAAAEMRDVSALLSVCISHLRLVSYIRRAL